MFGVTDSIRNIIEKIELVVVEVDSVNEIHPIAGVSHMIVM